MKFVHGYVASFPPGIQNQQSGGTRHGACYSHNPPSTWTPITLIFMQQFVLPCLHATQLYTATLAYFEQVKHIGYSRSAMQVRFNRADVANLDCLRIECTFWYLQHSDAQLVANAPWIFEKCLRSQGV